MVTVEQQLYISIAVLSFAWICLLTFLLLVWQQHRDLVRRFNEMDKFKPYKIQRAKVRSSSKSEYSFTNPVITPGEELARRGYSLYKGSDENIYNTAQDIGNNNKADNYIINTQPVLKNPRAASPQFVKTVSEISSKRSNERDIPKTPIKQSNANNNFSYGNGNGAATN